MVSKIKKSIIVASVGFIALTGMQVQAAELLGAGATFPYPLYAKMFDQYNKETKTKVNYQAIGSGGGIRQLKNKTVDFGATDAFLSDKKLKSLKRPIIHIPIVSGAVSISYNLPGNPDLKLSPDVLADIFLGKIKRWNDPRIKKLNPSIKLPKRRIATVQRSDGSGTTFIFTDYLAKVSKEWLQRVGRGKAVNWPTGLAGKGNAGVAGLIQQVPGSIGYVGSVYATQNKIPVAKIQNKAGYFVAPDLKGITAAGQGNIPDDTRVSLTDTSSRNGYPICGFTWLILYEDQKYNGRTLAQANETVQLIKWMISSGQQYAKSLSYAPLPKSVVRKANNLLRKVNYGGKRVS